MLIKRYILVLLFISVMPLFPETNNKSIGELQLTNEEIEWLKEHPKIRVAHDGFFPPYSYIDETGEYKGYVIDLMDIMAEKLGIQIEAYSNPTWSYLFSAAQKKEVDVVSLMIDTEERRKWFVFSDPYIFKSQVVITNNEYYKIKDRADLEGKKVAMVKDYQYVGVALGDFPTIQPYYVDNVLDSLLAVSTCKAEAAIATSGVAYYFMKKYLLNNLKFATLFSKNTSYESFGIRKDWPLLASIFNKTLKSIPEAILFELEDKWYTGDFVLKPSHEKIQLTPSEESWLNSNRNINLGFYPSMPPLLVEKGENNYDGIYPDILTELENLLDININIEVGNWKIITQKVKNKELDGLLACTEKEAQTYNLIRSNTILLSYPAAFTNIDKDLKIKNISSIRNKTIVYNREAHNLLNLLSALDTSNTVTPVKDSKEALLLVNKNRADVAIGFNFDSYVINQNEIENIEMTYLDVDTISPISFGIRDDWSELISILNKGLQIIGRDYIQHIQDNWIGTNKLTRKVPLTIEEEKWISENPVIRVGNEPDYAPYDFQIQGKPAGYSIEYIKLIADELGLNINYVQDSWDNLNNKIKDRKIDIIHPVSPIPGKHRTYLNFTHPFKKGVTCLVIHKDNKDIDNIEDLENKKIVVASGDAVIDSLKANIQNATYINKTNYEEALKAISNKEGDAMVTELSVASYLINSLSLKNLIIVDDENIRNMREMDYCIGIRKDWDILVSIFNKTMLYLPQKKIRKLDNSWLQNDRALILNPVENEWLKNHPVIKVGSDKSWAPFEFQDKNGQFYGLAIDYMNKIETLLDIKFEYVDEDWNKLIELAKNQKIDIFSCVSTSTERESYLLFTDSYIEVPTGIFAKDGVGYISDLSLLQNKKIAVVQGYAIQDFFTENYPNIELLLVSNPNEGIKSVLKDLAFGYIDNVVTTGHIISKEGYLHIDMVGETPFVNKQAIGIRKDWAIFRDILQKSIDAIPTTERNAIYNRWISTTYDKPFNYSLIWKIGIIILLVIALILIWNRKLADEVNKRTNELIEKEREYTTIFESANDSIMVMDQSGEFIFCNNKTVEMFGLTSINDVIGHSPLEFSPEVQADGIKSNIKINTKISQVIEGVPQLFEWIFKKQEGSTFFSEVSLILFEMKNKRRVAAFVRDINQRKLIEQEKRALGRYLENIINSMPSLIIGINDSKIVTQWNKVTEEYTGYSKEKAIGNDLFKIFPQLMVYKSQILESIKHQKIKHLQKQKCDIEGQIRFQDITIFPIENNKISGAVIRIDDITEKVQVEEMMVQSEKMLFVGNMAAGLAHEINNPMSALLQGTQTIQQRLAGDLMIPANEKAASEAGITIEGLQKFMTIRKIYRMLDDVRSSGIRVAGIVDNMLSFTRKAKGEKVLQDIHKLLDKTIELAASDFNLKENYDFKTISIEKEYDKNLPWIKCEAAKIQQVILNILGNGAHAMSEAKVEQPRFIIRTKQNKQKGKVTIEIEDNGSGIDKKDLKNIFEPFFTTKPSGVGTGLGLSVSYFIITEDHKGEMKVESMLGKGTTFIITLPVQ